jgi:hypothetical protein
VKVDEHWKDWTFKPAYCYCPHCNAKLKYLDGDSVDFAKHLKPVYVIPFIGVFVLALIAMATNSLEIVGPAMLGAFGVWLGKSSQLRDHRIIGWLLVGFAISLLWVFNYVLAA